MAYLLDTLPDYISEVLLSDEYFTFLSEITTKYSLNEQQDASVNEIVNDLFARKVQVRDLVAVVREKCGVSDEVARSIARDIVLNTALVFPIYFGDQTALYRELGGDPSDLETSETFKALMGYVLEKVKTRVDDLEAIDFEKEAVDTKRFFTNELVDTIKAPDAEYKASFNNMLIALLAKVDGFAQELVQAMLVSAELLGTKTLVVDGARVAPNVGNWLKDYISYCEGDVSTITIAKYIAESPAVKELGEEDRTALNKLLETFRVLRNFPDSLAKTPPEQWMIIPYRLEEAPIPATPGIADVQVSQPATSLPVEQSPSVVASPEVPAQAPAPIPVAPIAAAPVIPSETSSPRIETPTVQGPVTSPVTVSMEQYQTYADMVIDRSGLFFGNDQVKKRVRSSVVTYLKDIRDQFELKAILAQAVDAGGAGLAEAQADAMVKMAIALHDDLRAGRVPVAQTPVVPNKPVEVPPAPVVTPAQVSNPEPVQVAAELPVASTPIASPQVVATPSVSSFTRVHAVKPPKPTNAPRLTIEEVDGVPTIVQKKSEPKSELKQRDVKEQTIEMIPAVEPVVPVAQPVPAPVAVSSNSTDEGVSIPVILRKTAPSPYKTQLADVKASPQLIDPVEELRIFTLTDFRRLHSDPMEAVKRIYQKIQLLEKDSFARRQAGIAAWHENEVSRLYQEIGTQIFRKGASQDQVVAERTAAGQPTLTSKELDALMELNEMMSF